MDINSVFEKVKYFIIDMDGTFYLDGTLIDGALDFWIACTHAARISVSSRTIRPTTLLFAVKSSPKWAVKLLRTKSSFRRL